MVNDLFDLAQVTSHLHSSLEITQATERKLRHKNSD